MPRIRFLEVGELLLNAVIHLERNLKENTARFGLINCHWHSREEEVPGTPSNLNPKPKTVTALRPLEKAKSWLQPRGRYRPSAPCNVRINKSPKLHTHKAAKTKKSSTGFLVGDLLYAAKKRNFVLP